MSNPSKPYLLYGAPHSLYTGKARSYLRKQGVVYRELAPTHPSFTSEIVPKIGRGIIPVLVTPQGDVIQDTVDIIDHFERRGARCSAYPAGACQRVMALLVEFYGSLPLLRHAMHYRWSFLELQADFLTDAFVAGSGPQAATKIMQRMQSYLPALGVNAQTIPLIEQSYERLLDILEAHFAVYPYLFGGKPSIGDYGLLGPLFAHLGRDPVPSQLMKTRAPKVFRWIERMNSGDADVPEYPEHEAAFLAHDQIAPTLEPLFRHMAEEIFPELTDKLVFLDQWVATQRPADGEPVSPQAHRRSLGTVQSTFRGAEITTGIEPYLVYLLRRIDLVLARAPEAQRERVLGYLSSLGLGAAVLGERGYSVDRRNNIEVWQIG
jgi:glutathione S-transferase